MKFIEPKVFMLASTTENWIEIEEYLESIGAEEFEPDYPDAARDGEVLLELAGRSCYRSEALGRNPNVKKTRTGNKEYLANIIKSKHGSVLEHGSVTLAFVGVSRVFTHELVRHRAGAAYSQESLRFVRLDSLCAWYPESFGYEMMLELYDALATKGKVPFDERSKEAWAKERAEWLRKLFEETYVELELIQRNISNELYLDELDGNFHIKKSITSAMRRLAPIGLGTGIIFTANHRTLRHVIEMRTSPGAEEEIRLVFGQVAELMKIEFPNIYQDMERLDDGSYVFASSKI